MKVFTAGTDVSYLRDYKTGGEEGYAGRFAFRVIFVFQQPCLFFKLLVHSLCLSFWLYGTLPLVLRVLNVPAPSLSKVKPWQGILMLGRVFPML